MSHKTPTKPRLSENNHIKMKNNCNKWLLIGIKVLLLVNTERIKDMKKQELNQSAAIFWKGAKVSFINWESLTMGGKIKIRLDKKTIEVDIDELTN